MKKSRLFQTLVSHILYLLSILSIMLVLGFHGFILTVDWMLLLPGFRAISTALHTMLACLLDDAKQAFSKVC